MLGGRLLGAGCSLGWPCVLIVFWLFVILVISRFGLGTWFGLLLDQFLVFAYSFTFSKLHLRVYCFFVHLMTGLML